MPRATAFATVNMATPWLGRQETRTSECDFPSTTKCLRNRPRAVRYRREHGPQSPPVREVATEGAPTPSRGVPRRYRAASRTAGRCRRSQVAARDARVRRRRHGATGRRGSARQIAAGRPCGRRRAGTRIDHSRRTLLPLASLACPGSRRSFGTSGRATVERWCRARCSAVKAGVASGAGSHDRVPRPRATRGGRRRPCGCPGCGQARALLAILLLHANEPVASDRLIDDLWAGRPPSRRRRSCRTTSLSSAGRSAAS